MSSPTPTVTPSDATRLCNNTLAELNSVIAEMQAADTIILRDTGKNLLQRVAQLKARLDVYDAQFNVPSLAVDQHTFIPASMVPRPNPFDGCPENLEHFVVSINSFLGLTLSPQTPTSVKPHLLDIYDAFLQAFHCNYAGYDLELEARHSYHSASMDQSTPPSSASGNNSTTTATSLPRDKTYLRGFDITSGRCKYCHQTGHAIKQCPVLYQDELKTSDQDYDAALLEASWKFSNHYDQFLPGQVADESESDISSFHTSDFFSDTDTAEVAPAKRRSTAQAGVVRTRGRDLGKGRDTTTELFKPKTLEVALGSRNTRALVLRLHFKSPLNQEIIALALLDSCATHDLIDPRLLRKIDARKLPATSMADGSTPAAAYIHHKKVDITYSSGQLVCTAPFNVMTLGHYDAILGMSFLRR
ncbi:hypothetical protein RI367_006998 [Sorochytrium milnesiophthora]